MAVVEVRGRRVVLACNKVKGRNDWRPLLDLIDKLLVLVSY